MSISHALPARRCTRREGAWPGEQTQTGQRDVPHHRMPGSGYKLGGAGPELLITAEWQATEWCCASFLFLGVYPSLTLLFISTIVIIKIITTVVVFHIGSIDKLLLSQSITSNYIILLILHTSHQGRGMREGWLYSTQLLAGVKPWQCKLPLHLELARKRKLERILTDASTKQLDIKRSRKMLQGISPPNHPPVNLALHEEASIRKESLKLLWNLILPATTPSTLEVNFEVRRNYYHLIWSPVILKLNT